MVELFYGRFLAVGVLEGMHLNLPGLLCLCLFSACLCTKVIDVICRILGTLAEVHLQITLLICDKGFVLRIWD